VGPVTSTFLCSVMPFSVTSSNSALFIFSPSELNRGALNLINKFCHSPGFLQAFTGGAVPSKTTSVFTPQEILTDNITIFFLNRNLLTLRSIYQPIKDGFGDVESLAGIIILFIYIADR
jgi:hypothetical protein